MFSVKRESANDFSKGKISSVKLIKNENSNSHLEKCFNNL